MGSRTWVKLYCDRWLDGTIRQQDALTRAAFVDLLVLAGSGRFGDTGAIKVTDKTGLDDTTLCKIMGLSVAQWRKTKQILHKSQRISITFGNVIHITNWQKYQSEYERQKVYRSNPKLQPEVRPKVTDEIEIEKEIENKKEIVKKETKKKYGHFENVLLTDKEYHKLQDRFGVELSDRIENLSLGVASKGYKYTSCYAAILSWDRRDKQKDAKGKQRGFPERGKYTPTPDYPK